MRLLTRSDFDGLACSALLKEAGVVDSFKFIHPKDMQDGLVEVTDNDVLANVPYAPGCNMWFDHHSSEGARLGEINYTGESRLAPSCARIIYDYYGGTAKMPHMSHMVNAADKVDSGSLTREEILYPQGWVLLGFIMDPRTGLGRHKDFSVSNYDLMEKLIEACRTMGVDEILALPDIKERVKLYFEQEALFREMIAARTKLYKNVIVTDLRGVDTIYSGNRFVIYAIYPEQNISIWVTPARVAGAEKCMLAVGHSIINRTSGTDVSRLMLKYDGGGHRQVGTCQVLASDADRIIEECVRQMNFDG
jgi:nanoRNase/pAp phosphatase (c-di-AMP/oligoRNAs hydrolase)